jgi:hypothetical protein
MHYHAKLFYAGNKVLFVSNWAKEALIEKVIIPFINGQIVPIDDESTGKSTILNLKSASELKIYQTSSRLLPGPVSIREQMTESDFEKHDCTEEILQEAKLSFSSPNSQSLIQKSFTIEKDKVFVIMKYGDKLLDSAYEGVIKEVFKEFSLTVVRVDEIENSGNINDQILEQIASSKFVYSDLSGERPNCYYETGFAHALGKEIILVIKTNEKIHFDLASHRFIQWETENELRTKLKARINSIIKDNL